ncbi:T6SS phospholipase effector Tle1-like catalytic domain-containing protein [Massilia eurypsychrophila]|nr:DUF2235 domain-containing protein [Massilia eurypsychrophila]
MKKNQKNDQVGDRLSPALKPHAKALGADDVDTVLRATSAPSSSKSVHLADLAIACKLEQPDTAQALTCKQTLWFSFFFDGTGNNLDADEETHKHSNVAKLYRAHVENDKTRGIYRLYIPGVGTYFKEVGDPGGTDLGLGTGAFGEERLEWALKRFDKLLTPHVRRAANPTNDIVEVNISAFGFSRGAALARAFIAMFLEQRCSDPHGKSVLRLKTGSYPVRIRFMGLFDTVASVGTPMSMNNTSVAGAAVGSVALCINHRLNDIGLADVTPDRLAFAKDARPGADPAIGSADGHNSWGGRMRISPAVEEVRHFIAAHEMRNSFPVDSIAVLERGKIICPKHFIETVYPGAHSDVGGSYRPGEGGRAFAPSEKLGLIPLAHMFQHALEKGVPLLPRCAWPGGQTKDFEIQSSVRESYNHYIKVIGTKSSLGAVLIASMGLYFAWRFRAIRRKAEGDNSETIRVYRSHITFDNDKRLQTLEVAKLETKSAEATKKCNELRARRSRLVTMANRSVTNAEAIKELDYSLVDAELLQTQAQDAYLKAKAKLDTIPGMSNFNAMLTMYDKQLLSDVAAILKSISENSSPIFGPERTRATLRPHYRALVAAYENEYVHKKGLTDPKLIAFFDNYVHDSLSGFAKDATLPSDPRVVYVGGDSKLQYASLTQPERDSATA